MLIVQVGSGTKLEVTDITQQTMESRSEQPDRGDGTRANEATATQREVQERPTQPEQPQRTTERKYESGQTAHDT